MLKQTMLGVVKVEDQRQHPDDCQHGDRHRVLAAQHPAGGDAKGGELGKNNALVRVTKANWRMFFFPHRSISRAKGYESKEAKKKKGAVCTV